jgi:hypothetical protein
MLLNEQSKIEKIGEISRMFFNIPVSGFSLPHYGCGGQLSVG